MQYFDLNVLTYGSLALCVVLAIVLALAYTKLLDAYKVSVARNSALEKDIAGMQEEMEGMDKTAKEAAAWRKIDLEHRNAARVELAELRDVFEKQSAQLTEVSNEKQNLANLVTNLTDQVNSTENERLQVSVELSRLSFRMHELKGLYLPYVLAEFSKIVQRLSGTISKQCAYEITIEKIKGKNVIKIMVLANNAYGRLHYDGTLPDILLKALAILQDDERFKLFSTIAVISRIDLIVTSPWLTLAQSKDAGCEPLVVAVKNLSAAVTSKDCKGEYGYREISKVEAELIEFRNIFLENIKSLRPCEIASPKGFKMVDKTPEVRNGVKLPGYAFETSVLF